MRGIQIADALSRRGHHTQIRVGPSRLALADVRDSIVVCVKSCPLFHGWVRHRKNRIVYDAIDFTTLRGVPAYADVVIAGTDDMRDRLAARLNAGAVVKRIYHHADPHLKPHTAGESVLRLAYIGSKESSVFIKGEIPELNVVPFDGRNWREEIRKYNAHFSARLDPNKSVIKLANAATLGAVFLTGAEPGCVELLGKNYPFFLRAPDSYDTVVQDVRRLKEAVGTDLWKEARDRIESARPGLTIEAAALAYEELFAEISP
ncbi:MAG: hypothetical protein V1798_05785 [Pseudomonadota bacterium]